MSNIVKNERIKQTMKTTRKRHQNMTCRVFELKLNARKMSKPQKEQLTTYFREAKWRRNSIVANFDKAKRDAKSAFVKVGEIFEERPFTVLGSQVIQDIYDNVKTELKVLHTKKEKGEKVGRLKFKSFCNCIPLRQYNTTYRIDFLHKLVRIQNKGVKLASKRLNQAYKRNGQKKTNNHYRRIKKLRRAYERDRNRRTDNANKVVHEILANNDFVAIQDEKIHNWHAGLFGKQVQHSAMGYIKAKLKNNFKTHVVARNYPSTQICPVCGRKTKHPLKKRDYDCSYCGWHHSSRDVKSAQTILARALYEVNVSPEQRAKSLAEADTTTQVSQGICASIRQ